MAITVSAEFINDILQNRSRIGNKMEQLGVALATDQLSPLATKIEGIVNRGAVHASILAGTSFTIPMGFHNGSGTVEALPDDIDPNDFRLQVKTATPDRTQQAITPDVGYFGLASVTVYPIPSQYQDVSNVTATEPDVLATRLFVKPNGDLVGGTMTNQGAADIKFNALVADGANIPSGFHNGSGRISLTDDLERALAEI